MKLLLSDNALLFLARLSNFRWALTHNVIRVSHRVHLPIDMIIPAINRNYSTGDVVGSRAKEEDSRVCNLRHEPEPLERNVANPLVEALLVGEAAETFGGRSSAGGDDLFPEHVLSNLASKSSPPLFLRRSCPRGDSRDTRQRSTYV